MCYMKVLKQSAPKEQSVCWFWWVFTEVRPTGRWTHLYVLTLLSVSVSHGSAEKVSAQTLKEGIILLKMIS